MRSSHASLVDPLTGSRVDINKLNVSVESDGPAAAEEGSADLKCLPPPRGNAESITDWLQRAHALRCKGDASFRASLLLTGPPSSGKTCFLSQIVIKLLDGNEALDGNLVPIYIQFHDLQRRLLIEDDQMVFGQAWNWVDAYMQLVYGADSRPTAW